MASSAQPLRKEAAQRWLVKDELVFLLLHHKLVGVPVLRSLQLRPPSTSHVASRCFIYCSQRLTLCCCGQCGH